MRIAARRRASSVIQTRLASGIGAASPAMPAPWRHCFSILTAHRGAAPVPDEERGTVLGERLRQPLFLVARDPHDDAPVLVRDLVREDLGGLLSLVPAHVAGERIEGLLGDEHRGRRGLAVPVVVDLEDVELRKRERPEEAL